MAGLRQTRKGMRLSQKQLAELAGMDPTQLAKIELGASDVSLETLCAIAEVFRKKVEIVFR